jgi:hypothetical protein
MRKRQIKKLRKKHILHPNVRVTFTDTADMSIKDFFFNWKSIAVPDSLQPPVFIETQEQFLEYFGKPNLEGTKGDHKVAMDYLYASTIHHDEEK